jgi:hypothetical protein
VKPRKEQNAKAILMREFWDQAVFDLEQYRTHSERGPGFNYYYHDEMDHLVRLPVKYITTGHPDPRAPGGYVDNYAAKGYRSIGDDELLDIIKRQQAEKYKRLQMAPPWQTEAVPAAERQEVRRGAK